MAPSFFELKKCTKCGEEKPATTEFFCKCKSGKNGICAECKKCKALRAHNDRQNFSKEELKKRAERTLEWRKKNTEKQKQCTRSWREKNTQRAKETSAKWRKKSTEKIKEWGKKYSETLSDCFICTSLRLKKDQCPTELIEVKRLQLKIHRLCKTSKT